MAKVKKVKITIAGDSAYKSGDITPLGPFLTTVKLVLENGGEMPIAILVPS